MLIFGHRCHLVGFGVGRIRPSDTLTSFWPTFVTWSGFVLPRAQRISARGRPSDILCRNRAVCVTWSDLVRKKSDQVTIQPSFGRSVSLGRVTSPRYALEKCQNHSRASMVSCSSGPRIVEEMPSGPIRKLTRKHPTRLSLAISLVDCSVAAY